MGFGEAFTLNKARESADIVFRRLKGGKSFDIDVADYLRERAAIEERYAAELSRLGKRVPSVERDVLSLSAQLWDVLMISAEETAKEHTSFAHVVSKTEAKLRSRGDVDPEWRKLKQYEIEVLKLAKDVEDKRAKFNSVNDDEPAAAPRGILKAISRRRVSGEKAERKVTEARTALEGAESHWTSEAAKLFGQFQSMDESRLQVLQDSLLMVAQAESTLGSARASIPDKLVAAALGFDFRADIEAFCAAKANKGLYVPTDFDVPDSRRPSEAGLSLSLPRGSVSSPKPSIAEPPHEPSFPTSAATPTASSSNAGGEAKIVPLTAFALDPFAVLAENASSSKSKVDADGYTVPEPPTHEADDFDSKSLGQSNRIKIDIRKDSIVEPQDITLSALRSAAASLGGPATPRRLKSVSTARRASGMSTLDDHDNIFDGIDSPGRASMPGAFRSETASISSFNMWGGSAETASIHDEAGLPPPVPLHVFVTETANVMLKAGHLDKILVTGEIAFRLAPTAPNFSDGVTLRRLMSSGGGSSFRVHVNHYETIAKGVANSAVSRMCADRPSHSEFEVSLPALIRALMSPTAAQTGVIAVKYQVDAAPKPDAPSDRLVPLIVTPMWKFEANHTSLLLAYHVNESFTSYRSRTRQQSVDFFGNGTESTPSAPPVLKDVSVVVTLGSGGGEISGVQTKPMGVWSGERRALLWNVGEVGPQEAQEEGQEVKRLVARFETAEHMSELGSIAVRFSQTGETLSGVQVESVVGFSRPLVVFDSVVYSVVTGRFGAQ
ncbi:Muniscin C-terminal mu homology domain-containing protein [Cladochytrium replicatum]|nr:Muniscin C-terminal mu homology domain-containing protein [Cladochytrium replicatum]